MVQKRFKGVFKPERRPNYEALMKAVDKNPRMSEQAKARAKATLKRKSRGF